MLSRFSHRTRTQHTTQATFALQCTAWQHERQYNCWQTHNTAHLHDRDALREHGDAGRHARARATRASAARAAASQRRRLAARRTAAAFLAACGACQTWRKSRVCAKHGERCAHMPPHVRLHTCSLTEQAAAALALAGPCPVKARYSDRNYLTSPVKQKGAAPVPPPAEAGATGDPPGLGAGINVSTRARVASHRVAHN